MRHTISSVFDSVINAFLIIMLLVNLFNIVERNVYDRPMPKLLGYGYAIVVSGSMEPEISVNDVVYLKQQDSYKVGDIITFIERDPGQYETTRSSSLVTHRIVEVTPAGYITKGDANNTEDSAIVDQSQIEGRIFAIIPGIGATIDFMRKPIGTLWVILLALLLIELPYQSRTKKRIASETERKAAVSKLRPYGLNDPAYTPDSIVEDDPTELLLEGKKPRKMKQERAKREKKEHKSLFHRRPKIYVPEEGHWSLD